MPLSSSFSSVEPRDATDVQAGIAVVSFLMLLVLSRGETLTCE